MSELNCYKSSCSGTLVSCGESNPNLFTCDECGGTLQRAAVEKLATDSGPIGQLADRLVERNLGGKND